MKSYFFILFIILLASCNEEPSMEEPVEILRLQAVRVGTVELQSTETIDQAPTDKNIILTFSNSLEKSSAESNIALTDSDGNSIALNFSYLDNDQSISASAEEDFIKNTVYTITIGTIKSIDNEEYPGDTFQFKTEQGNFNLVSATLDENDLTSSDRLQNISRTPTAILEFTDAIGIESIEDFISIKNSSSSLPISFDLSNENRTLTISSSQEAKPLKKYTLDISTSLESISGLNFVGFTKEFYTQIDSTYKFPALALA